MSVSPSLPKTVTLPLSHATIPLDGAGETAKRRMHEVAPEKQDAVCWQLQQLPLIVDEHPKLGPAITFSFADCPCCKAELRHPSIEDAMVRAAT